MSEPGEPGPHVVPRPRRRTDQVEVDFTMLVRVPGQPDALRVFTDAESDDANKYAATTGGSVVPLPLSPPAGYAVGRGGNLVPTLPPTCAGMADGPVVSDDVG